MLSSAVIILLPSVTQAYGKYSTNRLAEKVLHRAFKVWSVHDRELEKTALAKGGRFPGTESNKLSLKEIGFTGPGTRVCLLPLHSPSRLFLQFPFLSFISMATENPVDPCSALAGFSPSALPSCVSKGPFCDIGLNLCDEMYKGFYNGKQKHDDDTRIVLERAKSMGMVKSIITAGNLEQSHASIDLVKRFNEFDLYSTVGVHPTRCSEFLGKEDEVISQLSLLIEQGMANGKVVAIGEAGLDYDRLQFCDKEQQMLGFLKQIDLAHRYGLPMFLHNRNTGGDFVRVVSEHRHKIKGGGVVHSFDGGEEELNQLLDLGFYIGLNGCSLRTEENLAVARKVPLERLLLETDSPWCGVKNTHAGMKHVTTTFTTKKRDKYEPGCMVKDRNEPCTIVQILEVLAAIKQVDSSKLANIQLA